MTFAALVLLTYVFVEISAVLYLGALVLNKTLPDTPEDYVSKAPADVMLGIIDFSTVSRPPRGLFHRVVARAVAGAARGGRPRIVVAGFAAFVAEQLDRAGQDAAAQIAIERGTRFDLLRAGYDERFARCSPGMLLTVESIRYAVRRGLRSYEFNGDAEPWTKVWTSPTPCAGV